MIVWLVDEGSPGCMVVYGGFDEHKCPHVFGSIMLDISAQSCKAQKLWSHCVSSFTITIKMYNKPISDYVYGAQPLVYSYHDNAVTNYQQSLAEKVPNKIHTSYQMIEITICQRLSGERKHATKRS